MLRLGRAQAASGCRWHELNSLCSSVAWDASLAVRQLAAGKHCNKTAWLLQEQGVQQDSDNSHSRPHALSLHAALVSHSYAHAMHRQFQQAVALRGGVRPAPRPLHFIGGWWHISGRRRLGGRWHIGGRWRGRVGGSRALPRQLLLVLVAVLLDAAQHLRDQPRATSEPHSAHVRNSQGLEHDYGQVMHRLHATESRVMHFTLAHQARRACAAGQGAAGRAAARHTLSRSTASAAFLSKPMACAAHVHSARLGPPQALPVRIKRLSAAGQGGASGPARSAWPPARPAPSAAARRRTGAACTGSVPQRWIGMLGCLLPVLPKPSHLLRLSAGAHSMPWLPAGASKVQ